MGKLEYRYPVEALYTGSSLGNLCAFARLSATTDLLGLWNSSDNEYYVGEWTVRLLASGIPLHPVATVVAPAHQATELSGKKVSAEQSFVLPLIPENGGDVVEADQRVALFLVTLRNQDTIPVPFLIRHAITFPAVATDRFTKQPSEEQRSKQVQVHRHGHFCTVTTRGRAEESRVFGAEIPWASCSADDATLNATYDLILEPGEEREVSFVLTFSPKGTEEALKAFKRSQHGAAIRSQAVETLGDILSRGHVFTPSPLMNRALQWAKVNMVRVRHRYRTGEAFTNDPPQDIVVLRDLAWFALGSDYLMPSFSRKMLHEALRVAMHEGGKVTEYYHADERNPVQHDYHLNINDDTPLVVWALHHHCVVTGDHSLLERFYPAMKRSCDWILRQVHDGLVWCSSQGTNVWGICSWRNIIDDYNLAGAVTEINAECYLALTVTADAARRLGRSADADRFASAAESLRHAVNSTLRSEQTGLYLLNIDNDGVRHHDVTGDLIFPVLAGVADEEMAHRVLDRLTQPDIWTEYGARTVSPSESNFDPEAGYQLLGGVWPNLTAWIALGLRRSRPEKVAEALENIYRIAEAERPADYAYVVPGEFPERLHGTGFQSRGMTLSPWTPPTVLWLGIEGLLGVKCAWDAVEMNPAIPSEWRWLAVRNLPLMGGTLTAFLVDGTLYASRPLTSSLPVRIGSPINTISDNEDIFTAGLLIDGELLLFAAADEQGEGTVQIEHQGRSVERAISFSKSDACLIRIPLDHPDSAQVRGV
jgi:glycogen debranching enzyme